MHTTLSEFIQDGKVVGLAYSLKDNDGEILDESTTQEPFIYLHGVGQVVPGLETGLAGLKCGDKKKVTVAPAEGYGEFNPELKMKIPKTQFPADVTLEVGMEFEAKGPEGYIPFTIEEIEESEVLVNGNHPLAGETLHFDVEVLSIRDASSDEKTHGHAHGPDGHHHH